MGARIEQALLGERARRDEADNVPPHHGLRPAFPRLGWVFDLLAHRHAVALSDQALEIVVGGMDRHAAHRDILAQMLAALCQRNTKGAGGYGGVLEEQLVEIAHAIEQQAIGIGGFDLEILRNHRGGRAGRPGLVGARGGAGGTLRAFGFRLRLRLGHGQGW